MDKGEAAERLSQGTAWLAEEQDILYAQDRWSLLLIFQAMDAAGKDGTIKHVMSGINRRAARCFPSSSLRRKTSTTTSCGATSNVCPNAGASAFSNRSYYEEVLVVRVHRKSWQAEASGACVGKKIWDERLADLANFENYLTRQGTLILKFFLYVSRDEQKKAFHGASQHAREVVEVFSRRYSRA
jgi:polyphosphate kinase 2 (PPK2 family)